TGRSRPTAFSGSIRVEGPCIVAQYACAGSRGIGHGRAGRPRRRAQEVILMETEIFFRSGGLRCAADLYLPDDRRSGAKQPGLVIGHGFSVVKEALVEHGRAFARAGFVTLA